MSCVCPDVEGAVAEPPERFAAESGAGLVDSLIGDCGAIVAEAEPGEDAWESEFTLEEGSDANKENEGCGEDSLAGASTVEVESLLEACGGEEVPQGEEKKPRSGAIGKRCHVAGPLRRQGE